MNQWKYWFGAVISLISAVLFLHRYIDIRVQKLHCYVPDQVGGPFVIQQGSPEDCGIIHLLIYQLPGRFLLVVFLC